MSSIITEEISFIPNTTIWTKVDSFLVTYWELILIGMIVVVLAFGIIGKGKHQ